MLAGARGWRVNSASHFAERHGLIILIALGESVVSIGIGVTDLPISWPIIVASTLGLMIAGALWWAYFDVVALVAERVLARATGEQRARIARDSYSLLHLPMVIGIIFLSLGLKKVLSYVGGGDGHSLTDPLYGVPLVALYGGTSLYLLAHIAFRWRNIHSRQRPPRGRRGAAAGAHPAGRRASGDGHPGPAGDDPGRDDRLRGGAVRGRPRCRPSPRRHRDLRSRADVG